MIIEAGSGIQLELLDEKHAEKLLQLRNHSYYHLAEWLPWVPFMQSVEDFVTYIKRCRQRHVEGVEVPLAILANGEVAGRIGLNYIDANRIGAIGYWIGADFGGKGIISKACEATIVHGFTQKGLNRIEIKCGVENHRSQAIPERLGFIKEGILRQAELLNGKFIDLFLYSMLQLEWKAKQNNYLP